MSDFVSLFAGVGGFDLAFERAGLRCVGQVEKDTHCRKVLDAHWPDVPKWEDIADVRQLPSTDVLVGGFPCQDYSVAGRRGGLAADRGALWWQFHRLIAECRPRWVVGENVPGLLSSNDGRDFRTIVGSLVELGYGVCWRILDAQWFGVAQRRRRVFIVGHLGGVPRPEILFEPEGLSWDSPPRREPRQDVAPTLAGRTRGGGGLGTDTELDGGLVTYLAVPDVAQPVRTNWRNNSDSTTEARMHIYQGSSVRRLTPLECERLQGFPDHWTVGQSDTQRYRQMGNAVCVPVAEWVGRAVA